MLLLVMLRMLLLPLMMLLMGTVLLLVVVLVVVLLMVVLMAVLVLQRQRLAASALQLLSRLLMMLVALLLLSILLWRLLRLTHKVARSLVCRSAHSAGGFRLQRLPSQWLAGSLLLGVPPAGRELLGVAGRLRARRPAAGSCLHLKRRCKCALLKAPAARPLARHDQACRLQL